MPRIGPHINAPPRAVKGGVLLKPHLTICPRCGRPTIQVFYGDLVWLEINGQRVTACYEEHWEAAAKDCGAGPGDTVSTRRIGANERVPGTALCPSCEARRQQLEKIVADGGVRFKCGICGATGAIESNNWTKGLRKAALESGEIKTINEDWGVLLDDAGCPNCRGAQPQEEKSADED